MRSFLWKALSIFHKLHLCCVSFSRGQMEMYLIRHGGISVHVLLLNTSGFFVLFWTYGWCLEGEFYRFYRFVVEQHWCYWPYILQICVFWSKFLFLFQLHLSITECCVSPTEPTLLSTSWLRNPLSSIRAAPAPTTISTTPCQPQNSLFNFNSLSPNPKIFSPLSFLLMMVQNLSTTSDLILLI